MEDYRKSKFAQRFENKTQSLGKKGFTSILNKDSFKSNLTPSRKLLPSETGQKQDNNNKI